MLRALVTTADGLATWPDMSCIGLAIPCKGLGCWGQDSDVVPFLLVREVLASLVKKNAGDVSSFAAIPQQLWGVKRDFCAKHGIKDHLTLGLGGGVAHQKRGRPDNAHRNCWRARPSKGSVSTLCSLCLGFSAELICIDVVRSGRRPGWDTSCFQFPA